MEVIRVRSPDRGSWVALMVASDDGCFREAQRRELNEKKSLVFITLLPELV